MRSLFIIAICGFLTACNGSGNTQESSPLYNNVEYAEDDYTKTYYIINNVDKFVNGGEYDTNDLKEAGSLLFSKNGIVKAIEFTNGWITVSHFTKKTAVPGYWWVYEVHYDVFGSDECMSVYLPME